jgi:D-amino-acid dehydrogenase
MPQRAEVVVVAGAVGVAVAHAVAARGASVTVLERHERPAMGCSAGNAGIVGPRHVEPLASMEALWEGVRALPRRDGPLALRVRPSTAGWLARFAVAAARNRDGAAAAALRVLAGESATQHRAIAQRLDTGWAQRGFLSVYRDAAAFDHGRRLATDAQVIEADALRRSHSGFAEPLAGAILDPEEAHCDPERFVRALAEEATTAHSVEILGGVEVLGLRARGRHVDRLLTSRGEIAAGTVIVAAGAWSASLLRGLGVALPLQGGKGYHVEVPSAPGDPDLPVYLPERRVVITPLDGRLRIAGTLEIAGTDERVSARRLDAVLAGATALLPSLAARTQLRVWRGLRPCTPDGVPVVGRAPQLDNVVLATGHGMWGMQLAPVTGRVVADLLEGAPQGDAERVLEPARFEARRLRSRRPRGGERHER